MAAVCFWGCTSSSSKPVADSVEKWLQIRLLHYNDSIFPAINQQVQNGDLVTRLGTDITSELFRKLNQEDQSFSHCGIASVENDTVFVYHAIGGEFNPDQTLKREPLYSFGHPADNKALGIFRPHMDALQTAVVVNNAQKAYANKLMFDMKFDYNTDDRQYCAEFVAKSFVKALQDSQWLHFTKTGQLEYIAVDNLFRSKLVTEIKRYYY